MIDSDDDPSDRSEQPIDVEREAQSAGVPSQGQHDHPTFNPLGNPGVHHWQASFVTRPGLHERGNIFFAAVEMTRMPMAVTDANEADNPIVFVNRAFLDLTLYAESDVLGRNCRFLQGDQTDPDTVAEVRAAIADQRAVAVEILNYKADGTPFWNALFIGPVFDQHGKLLYFFSSQMDITRRRVSEQSFRQAQKMEAIGQLTAGLAHDFNNLLQVITGNVEIAYQCAGDNAMLRAAMDRIDRATQSGAKLTQQLLAFARKQRLEPKRTSLNTLVVEFSEMLSTALGPGIEVKLDLQSGVPPCTLDGVHLEMALLNILINARDAMPNGGTVTITTGSMHLNGNAEAHHLPPGQYAVLAVRDEGVGMPPDVLQRATEPFFTTKGHGTGTGTGTGLGLAMVHGFVQQSGGRLEIDSKPGVGTSIRMLFPVAAQQKVSAHELAASGGVVVESTVPAQTILVVDDSDDVRELAQSYLTSQGYRVLVARSGEEALRQIDSDEPIDLLFTDLVMPGGMNGLVLAESARRIVPDLAVLLTTGYMDELAAHRTEASSLNVLSKPYRRTELLGRVRAALGRRRATDR